MPTGRRTSCQIAYQLSWIKNFQFAAVTSPIREDIINRTRGRRSPGRRTQHERRSDCHLGPALVGPMLARFHVHRDREGAPLKLHRGELSADRFLHDLDGQNAAQRSTRHDRQADRHPDEQHGDLARLSQAQQDRSVQRQHGSRAIRFLAIGERRLRRLLRYANDDLVQIRPRATTCTISSSPITATKC